MFEWKNHDLTVDADFTMVRYEKRPCRDQAGKSVDGLFNAWIILDNQTQLNSYTTGMVKAVILAFRRASEERDVANVVFTGAGTRAFCTGGNTKEYAEYYAGRPSEYSRYMRLFNDMVTAILHCDKPVISRVNGMRIAGGQEIGMACDFTVAGDHAAFGQAGPKHGSAPDGGSTDFLPLFVGIERAMQSCTLCETWSAYRALQYGLVTDVQPVYRFEDRFIANPLIVTDPAAYDFAKPLYGEWKKGADREKAMQMVKASAVDLSKLDEAVEALSTRLLYTMPGCLSKTIESVRKHKMAHWDKNRETNRSWLGLNMMTEAKAGFRAFNEGTKEKREVDFVHLRKELAAGAKWSDEFIDSLMPNACSKDSCTR